MSTRSVAVRLSLIVALAGLVPIATVGIISTEVLRQRSERDTQAALRVIAEQAAARIAGFVSHQQELVRTVASLVDPTTTPGKLAETVVDAPSLGQLSIVSSSGQPTTFDSATVALAINGHEAMSKVLIGEDTTPALDMCAPVLSMRSKAVCAHIDLLELWRFVQRIQVGASGYALAFDDRGKLLASGNGALRGAILTGTTVPEQPYVTLAQRDAASAPTHYDGATGAPVLAAWANLKSTGWTVVVEQPASEALRPVRTAQVLLFVVLGIALVVSILVGGMQSRRVLAELEVEERWKTAGRIAAGVTHDLGHRLRVLQQTVQLADSTDPAYLPRIRDNLKTEVATLKKFVADFSDLSRNVQTLERFPLEVGTFLISIQRAAAPHAESHNVMLEIQPPPKPAWVNADRHLMERAALNLVSNAIEASSAGKVVTLAAKVVEGRCLLEVSDRGSGIAPDRLPRLFDAFASTKRTGAHLGMGLPNVKRIIDAHRGQVSAESKLGEGTTFRISLPEIPAPAGAHAAA